MRDGQARLGLSVFPGIDALGLAFAEVFPEVCWVRGPDPIFGSLHDVRRFHPPAGAFWAVIGGPPCQEFSSLSYLVRHNGHQVKWGNLIPDYERICREAQPEWFLMENVPQAPVPQVDGYTVQAYLLNNRWIGGVQMRKRRFSFGTRDGRELDFSPDLCLFEAVECDVAVYAGDVPSPSHRDKLRRQAVTSDMRVGDHRHMGRVRGDAAVIGLVGMLRLQELPGDFLDDSPFTMAGKKAAVGNAVPLGLGRAVARAIRRALDG